MTSSHPLRLSPSIALLALLLLPGLAPGAAPAPGEAPAADWEEAGRALAATNRDPSGWRQLGEALLARSESEARALVRVALAASPPPEASVNLLRCWDHSPGRFWELVADRWDATGASRTGPPVVASPIAPRPVLEMEPHPNLVPQAATPEESISGCRFDGKVYAPGTTNCVSGLCMLCGDTNRWKNGYGACRARGETCR